MDGPAEPGQKAVAAIDNHLSRWCDYMLHNGGDEGLERLAAVARSAGERRRAKCEPTRRVEREEERAVEG